MKIKEGFVLRQVAGSYIVIGVSDEMLDLNGMITVNETGAFLWNILQEDVSEEGMLKKLLAEYDVDEDIAKKDISDFVNKLKDGKLLII